MATRILRNRRPINYFEPEEPPDDAYEFCAECGIFTFEHCSIHGGLLVIPDDKVPAQRARAGGEPRAVLTAPKFFLYVAPSSIPGAGAGVFAKRTLPQGVRFGPYCGQRIKKAATEYCWQICDAAGRASHVVDASDASASNWMRYVNCARHVREQNLVAYQFHGQIYYRTSEVIYRGTELLVFYGSEFAAQLNIHLGKYHSKDSTHLTMKNPETETQKSKTIYLGEALNSMPYEVQLANAYITALIRLEKHYNKERLEPLEYGFSVDALENARNKIIQKANSNPVQVEESNLGSKDVNVDQDAVLDSDSDEHEVVFIDAENENVGHKSDPENDGNVKKIPSAELDLLKTKENANSNMSNSLWRCNVCNKVLGSRDLLRSHKRMHSGAQKFNCPICSYKTDSHFYYKKHEQSHKKTEGRKNENKPETAYQRDVRIPTSWQCKECQNVFSTRDNLRNHKRLHSAGAHKYQCNTCGYQTKKKFAFIRHVKSSHSNNSTLLKCSRCSFSTRRDNVLKIHEDLHTNTKTIKCDMCDYLCTNNKYLNAHLLRVHVPTKLHQCAVCTSAFNCAEYLRRHMRNVHGTCMLNGKKEMVQVSTHLAK